MVAKGILCVEKCHIFCKCYHIRKQLFDANDIFLSEKMIQLPLGKKKDHAQNKWLIRIFLDLFY